MQRSIFHPSGAILKNNCSVDYQEYLDVSEYTACGQNGIYFGTTEGSEAFGWSDSLDMPILSRVDRVDVPPLELVPSMTATSSLQTEDDPLIQEGGLDTRKDEQDQVSESNTHEESEQNHASEAPEYPYLYRLHAVVLHYGSHDSGHFVTYRRFSRNPFQPTRSHPQSHTQDRWYSISDDRVSRVSNIQHEVYEYGSSFVYLLFYQRVLGISETEATALVLGT